MVPALEFPLNYPENRPSHRPGDGHHRVSADDQRYVIGYERSGVRGLRSRTHRQLLPPTKARQCFYPAASPR